MDCTASMSASIKQAAKNLVQILQTVKQKSKFDANIRAAYVGYRDFGDKGDDRHFDVMDYTTDIEKISKKIKSSRASGGGDTPEDMKGALDLAFKLSHKNSTLCIFMITDAPGHGRQYHNCDDYHPRQPKGSLEEAFCQFRRLPKTNVHFTAMQLNQTTQKMFGMVKRAFGNNFYVTEKLIPADFFATMFNSITCTIE